MVTISEIEYKNFGRCILMENEVASVIVTVEVGPRIISYCLNGKENMLLEDTDREFFEQTAEYCDFFGEDEIWYIYGGHRLWSSPESYPQSYVPDNYPCECAVLEDGTLCVMPEQTATGQQHCMYIRLDENTSRLTVTHSIQNVLDKEVTLAPWAMTVCSAGGVEIFPQNTSDNGLLSNRRNVYWSYSDIKDDRFFIGNRYGTLQQVKGAEGKFKIGINNEDGWAAYVNHGQIFKKNFNMNVDGNYPDYGCNFETFTNGIFLECESLGELETLQPSETVYLSEVWSLIPCDETFDRKDEESIHAFVEKYGLDK